MSLRSRFAGPVVTLIVVVGLATLIAWLSQLPEDLSRYETAVREIEASPDRRAEFEQKYRCYIEPGPPLRVAFSQGGILDNWEAIVYDPSGEVLKARGFKHDLSNLGDPDLQHVKDLFGGDLIWAEPLGGHWYRCGFT